MTRLVGSRLGHVAGEVDQPRHAERLAAGVVQIHGPVGGEQVVLRALQGEAQRERACRVRELQHQHRAEERRRHLRIGNLAALAGAGDGGVAATDGDVEGAVDQQHAIGPGRVAAQEQGRRQAIDHGEAAGVAIDERDASGIGPVAGFGHQQLAGRERQQFGRGPQPPDMFLHRLPAGRPGRDRKHHGAHDDHRLQVAPHPASKCLAHPPHRGRPPAGAGLIMAPGSSRNRPRPPPPCRCWL